MKKMIKHLFLTLMTVLMFVSSSFPALADDFYFLAEESGFSYFSQYNIDLGLFGPGDTYTKTITTDNQTRYTIYYMITDTENNISSQELYNVIELTITDLGGNIIYSGKLKDVQTDRIYIDPNTTQKLIYEFYFPKECKNEFQGKTLDCTIWYYAAVPGGEHVDDIHKYHDFGDGHNNTSETKTPITYVEETETQSPETPEETEESGQIEPSYPDPGNDEDGDTHIFFPKTGDEFNKGIIGIWIISGLAILIIIGRYVYEKKNKK